MLRCGALAALFGNGRDTGRCDGRRRDAGGRWRWAFGRDDCRLLRNRLYRDGNRTRPLLTAAHCVQPGADYKFADGEPGQRPVFKDIAVSNATRNSISNGCSLISPPPTLRFSNSRSRSRREFHPPLSAAKTKQSPSAIRSLLPAMALPCAAPISWTAWCARQRSVVTGHPGSLQIRLFDPATKGDTARARRLHRRFRRARFSRYQRQPCDHWRGELVDRRQTFRWLRRANRHHAAGNLPRMDRRHGASAWLAAWTVKANAYSAGSSARRTGPCNGRSSTREQAGKSNREEGGGGDKDPMKRRRHVAMRRARPSPASSRPNLPDAPPSTIAPNTATMIAPPSERKKFKVPVAVPI